MGAQAEEMLAGAALSGMSGPRSCPTQTPLATTASTGTGGATGTLPRAVGGLRPLSNGCAGSAARTREISKTLDRDGPAPPRVGYYSDSQTRRLMCVPQARDGRGHI